MNPWPTELRLAKDRRTLSVTFEDGASYDLPAELLRVESRSADVRGHHPSERKIVSGKRNVEIISITPVGNYAVRLFFDDLYDNGIYSWATLRDLGARQTEIWQAYLAELAEKGLSRDPAPLG